MKNEMELHPDEDIIRAFIPEPIKGRLVADKLSRMIDEEYERNQTIFDLLTTQQINPAKN